MNERDDNPAADGQFDDLLNELGQLAGLIDRQSYPGRAWPAGRRRRWLVPAMLAGAAAAAAIVLAVVLPKRSDPPQVPVAQLPATQPASAPAQPRRVVALPSGIDPADWSDVVFEIPTVNISPGNQAGGMSWDLPAISFPSWSEGSESNDSDKGQSGVDGRHRDRGLAFGLPAGGRRA